MNFGIIAVLVLMALVPFMAYGVGWVIDRVLDRGGR